MDEMDKLIKDSLAEDHGHIIYPPEAEMFERIMAKMEQGDLAETTVLVKKRPVNYYKYIAAAAVFLLAINGLIQWEPQIANAVSTRVQTWAIKNGIIQEKTQVDYENSDQEPVQQNANDLPTILQNYQEARATVTFPIKEPKYIPLGFGAPKLELASDDTLFTATYSNNDALIQIVQNYCVDKSASTIGYSKDSSVEKITIHDNPGYIIYTRATDTTFIVWQELSVKYNVYGNVGKEETLKIASELE